MRKPELAPRAALLAVAFCCFAAPAKAQPGGRYGYRPPHHTGCFVTTSPQHHQKGIRHWRNPCPYVERRHMNPYFRGYHRPYRMHPSPH